MNYTLMVYMMLLVNIFFAGLFPEQVGLSDPYGIEEIRQQEFNNFDSNTQAYFVQQGVFNPDGTPAGNFDKYKELAQVGETEAGVSTSEAGTLSFIDYFKIAWNTFQSLGIFLIAFITIMFQLPLNISTFIAPFISIVGILALVKFIVGR